MCLELAHDLLVGPKIARLDAQHKRVANHDLETSLHSARPVVAIVFFGSSGTVVISLIEGDIRSIALSTGAPRREWEEGVDPESILGPTIYAVTRTSLCHFYRTTDHSPWWISEEPHNSILPRCSCPSAELALGRNGWRSGSSSQYERFWIFDPAETEAMLLAQFYYKVIDEKRDLRGKTCTSTKEEGWLGMEVLRFPSSSPDNIDGEIRGSSKCTDFEPDADRARGRRI